MTGAAAIVVLVRVAPKRGEGGAGEEVGASPGHSRFLFLARSADLEFTTSDNSWFKSCLGSSSRFVALVYTE